MQQEQNQEGLKEWQFELWCRAIHMQQKSVGKNFNSLSHVQQIIIKIRVQELI